jgi:hypothetical protein
VRKWGFEVASVIVPLIILGYVLFAWNTYQVSATSVLDIPPVQAGSKEPPVVQPNTVGKFGCYLATPPAPYIVTINGAKYMHASAETWCDSNKTVKLQLRITGSVVGPGGYPIWTINTTANTHYTRSYDNPCSGTPRAQNVYTIAELFDSAGTLIVYNTSATAYVDCR